MGGLDIFYETQIKMPCAHTHTSIRANAMALFWESHENNQTMKFFDSLSHTQWYITMYLSGKHACITRHNKVMSDISILLIYEFK